MTQFAGSGHFPFIGMGTSLFNPGLITQQAELLLVQIMWLPSPVALLQAMLGGSVDAQLENMTLAASHMIGAKY